jgi:dTMP kinase
VPRGKFITLEGGEGAGKSTQVARLVGRLRAAGEAVIATREPGGTAFAEALRGVLVGEAAAGVDPIAEALAHFAARADHVARKILPALEAGQHVVSDRFFDSTFAYQAVAGGIDAARFAAIRHAAIGDFAPDLTLVLDVPIALGMARARDANRYEALGEEFHARVRDAFRGLPDAEPARCVLIDAAGGADEVAARIAAVVRGRLGITL